MGKRQSRPWIVSDEPWSLIEPLLPEPPPKQVEGRPRVPDRQALCGILFDLIAQDRYTTAASRRLHAVAAELAHCAAWLRFDADRHADVQHHWQAAVHAAHQADDRDLAAIALSDLAYQATWLSKPADAVQALEHARSRTRTPGTRSLLDVRLARACAVLQDRQGTQRALASAEAELEQIRPQATPPAVSWM